VRRDRPVRPTPSPGAAPATSRRLARAVQELEAGLSFSRAKRAVLDGQVTVDGEPVRDPGALVPAGAVVSWHRDRPIERQSEERVALVHADADVAVADKPAGLLTVPTPAGERDTLIARVAQALARERTAAERKRGVRPHVSVVHRLDRDTTGLVVFALNRPALADLQGQLLDRSMGRGYDAFVLGDVAGEAGTIDRALIGDGVRRRRWVTRPGERGKPAVTHWRVTERFGVATRLRVVLETGRTHQIRIHLAAAGHPVVGEPVYRARGVAPDTIPFPRQALHAAELRFRHPRNGRDLLFTAPLPEDLERLLDGLRRGRMAR
jgi:23S rRNA pseudouridine1911/1915/1917 synthase